MRHHSPKVARVGENEKMVHHQVVKGPTHKNSKTILARQRSKMGKGENLMGEEGTRHHRGTTL